MSVHQSNIAMLTCLAEALQDEAKEAEANAQSLVREGSGQVAVHAAGVAELLVRSSRACLNAADALHVRQNELELRCHG